MRFSRKIPSFIFGLSVGLLIGVGYYVFKVNDIFDRLKASAKEQITVIEQPVKNNSGDTKSEKKGTERFKIDLGSSARTTSVQPDSLIRDNAENNINVATDQMISSKSVKLIKIGEKPVETDSSAAKLADVQEEADDLFTIEFWKTPLNSKGYRFLKNKVILYGFEDFNNVLIYQLGDSYYIKCEEQVYKIFQGADFKPLEKVLDAELLARIS